MTDGAALLREAAQTLREKAEAATPGPWDYWQMAEDGRFEVYVPNGTMDTETVLAFVDFTDCEECSRPSDEDADYITQMDPTVALAVADWLESEVELCEWEYDTTHALAVARAVLRRES